MLRSVLAVLVGFAVNAVGGLLAAMAIALARTRFDDPDPASLLPGVALGAFLGGVTAARIGRTEPLRHAGALAAILVALSAAGLVPPDLQQPAWYLAVAGVLRAAGAGAGGITWARVAPRRRTPGTSPSWSAGARLTQLLLAVFFLLASSIVTVGVGHGVVLAGQLVLLSPVAAALGAVAVVALFTSALTLEARMFAVCCSVVAVPVVAPLMMIWTMEPFDWFFVLTAVPFLSVWGGIVVRAFLTRRRVAARAAA